MSVLKNNKHEHFAQSVAKGVNATKAYVSAGYSRADASPSAAGMLTNVNVFARIQEQRNTIASGLHAGVDTREVSAQLAAQQDRWERMQRVIDAANLSNSRKTSRKL